VAEPQQRSAVLRLQVDFDEGGPGSKSSKIGPQRAPSPREGYAAKRHDLGIFSARDITWAYFDLENSTGLRIELMFTLNFPVLINTYCGNYDAANEHLKELVVLAEEKGAPFRKAEGVLRRGYVLTLTGKATEAVEMVTSGIDLWRSAGSTIFTPEHEFMLAIAHADSGQFDDAWRCIGKAMTAMQATKEKWCEAEAHRVAGEIALKSPQRDVAKAQAYFEHSLTVARAQQAKSWELRAAMSLARLLSDQGKRQTARDVLVPIHDWFTEGFDTSDLRKAKALIGELHG
jgi:predicted ATPase